ncbi:protein similar [Episyrphus balteatus]|uniref:protein similar n=1 Tax=Episyrphus balteatus TaxID=286459 RepID=UPI0024858E14|nr:protein similar [Episyrphus balteatus]
MYNNGNVWESCRFDQDTQELLFYEDGDQFSTYDPKIAMLSNSNLCVNVPVVVNQQVPSPQFLTAPKEHCVNFNSPYNQLPTVPLAYTPPPLPMLPNHQFISSQPSPIIPPPRPPPVQQFGCGGGMPVARQVITAAPYYNIECRDATFAPCQNVQPWTYAYCYGYVNQQPCQFTEFVDIEDFMSNEKRKEKSRDAARCRRSRETEIFTDLAQVLPLPKDNVDQLDKASIMRVAIAYLKIRDMLHLFPKIQDIPKEESEKSETSIISNKITNNDEDYSQSSNDEKEPKPFDLWKAAETHKILSQALDGFMIILSNDGDVTYVSENINEYLGISKIDMLGQQIWEYAHQCDHDELKEALNIKKSILSEKVKDENLIEEGITTDHRDLFIRLKCTLTSRGRSVNIKSASYKVIHITGHLVVNAKGDRVLIAVGRPIPHPSNIEIPLGSTTFLTKHSLDMKFTYVDDKMDDLFGYKPEDLLDKSLYECHHGGDSDSLIGTFKCALSKGQGETCRYRFLGKCGGYCYIVTQATIVYDKQKPQSVVCVNYVISNLENNNEIYSLAQFEASQLQQQQQQQQQQVDDKIDSTVTSSPKPQIVIENQQQQKPIVEITTENKPKSIIIQKQQQQQKDSNINIIDLEKTDLVPKLSSKKTCVDVDEKISTSAAELQNNLKRENPNNNTNDINNQSLNKPIIINSDSIKFVPSSLVTQPSSSPSSSSNLRNLQHRPDLLFGRHTATPPLSVITTNPPKFIEEKRPKSVTASVFRIATVEKLPVNAFANSSLSSNTICGSIALNQSNYPQLNVAPTAQSVTASVFTPISKLRASSQQNFTPTTPTSGATGANQQQQQQNSSSTGQRSVEMNKGFHLSFADDTTGLTMLKEEPDDLAHLAPTGLDENTPLFNEMLAGLMSYSGLLPDDINSLDSQNSGNQSTNNKGHIDPFINYREESNDTNCSQHLLSPGGASKSPEASSLPSLCSPNSLSQEDDFPFMTMNVDDEIDLSMRAPYIPMNEQEDLPLLTDDLMWGVGFASEDLAIHKDDAMQYNTLKQQLNLSPTQTNTSTTTTNNRIMLNNHQNCHNSTNLLYSSPSASPMSMSSSSAASSPSPCSPHSSISSMHNQSNFGGAMLCNNARGGGSGGGGGCGSGGGGDGGCSSGAGGCGSSLCVDDSDSGISSINSMSPQHTHQQQQHHRQQQQHHHHHHLSHHQHQQQQTHQQQQQQQHHSPMSLRNDGLGLITCKKEIDGGNLCESIDAFDSVYTKDSSNLDCWTVQELLNINSTDSNIAIDNNLQQQQTNKQQQQQQQSIIINTATMPTTTLHVPLITIQNNKNISMNHQQQQQQQQQQLEQRSTSSPLGGATTIVATNSASNCHNSNNTSSNKQQQQQCGNGSLILSEEIIQNNRKLSPKIPTSNTAATIRITTTNGGNIGRHHQTSPKTATILHTTNLTALQNSGSTGNNHKRHLTTGGASTLESKRLKNSSTSAEIQTSLLQQLMATAPQQKQKVVVRGAGGYDKSQSTSRWNNENGGSMSQQQQQMLRNQDRNHQSLNQSLNSSSSASNSVLKNLLISGCDVSAGYCIVPVRPKKLAKA